jgi:hypothetical protein
LWRGIFTSAFSRLSEGLAAGEPIPRSPVRLGLAHLPGYDELLIRFPFDHKPLTKCYGSGEGITDPDQRISIPSWGIEQAHAAEIVVSEVGEVFRSLVKAPEFKCVILIWRIVVLSKNKPGSIEICRDSDV